MKIAIGALILLLVAVQPIASRLRDRMPPAPEMRGLGLGPLLGGVLTGAFRPLLMNYLYIRADILAGQGRFDEQVTLFRGMVQLYPHNEEARGYLGWELAFNSKGEAATPELAWRWAREGLDILADSPSQSDIVALWFMAQCGQNANGFYRYAGPEWLKERWIRERAEAWTASRWGRPMPRFDAALRALGEPEDVLARFQHVRLLRAALLDDWMRTGRSDRLEATMKGLLWIAWVFKDLPEQEAAARQSADALRAIAAGEFDAAKFPGADEEEANALWALGMHRQDASMLRAALALFESQKHHEFISERRIVRAWIDWLATDRSTPRPPRPFDS